MMMLGTSEVKTASTKTSHSQNQNSQRQHHILLQRQMPSERNGRQTGMVVIPDGSLVPVASGATSQQRSDVSSVERPNNNYGHSTCFFSGNC